MKFINVIIENINQFEALDEEKQGFIQILFGIPCFIAHIWVATFIVRSIEIGAFKATAAISSLIIGICIIAICINGVIKKWGM